MRASTGPVCCISEHARTTAALIDTVIELTGGPCRQPAAGDRLCDRQGRPCPSHSAAFESPASSPSNLAAAARETPALYEDVRIVEARFEDWQLPDGMRFDLVFRCYRMALGRPWRCDTSARRRPYVVAATWRFWLWRTAARFEAYRATV